MNKYSSEHLYLSAKKSKDSISTGLNNDNSSTNELTPVRKESVTFDYNNVNNIIGDNMRSGSISNFNFSQKNDTDKTPLLSSTKQSTAITISECEAYSSSSSSQSLFIPSENSYRKSYGAIEEEKDYLNNNNSPEVASSAVVAPYLVQVMQYHEGVGDLDI